MVTKQCNKLMRRKMSPLESGCIAMMCLSCAGLSAYGGFVNGGFEDGNFNGWTVEYKKTYGATWLAGPGPVGNIHQNVIGAVADPYSPFDTPFNGSYMAQLNKAQTGADMSRISQTGTMLAGETDVYINWGAVLQDPAHAVADQPFFTVEVLKNNVSYYSFSHTAGAGGNAGWTPSPGYSGIYYKSGVAHVSGLNAGDTVKVILTVADCDLGGHFGYAYLDGIGTVAETPPPGVPDGGATIAMLGLALAGFAGFRRKLGA